MKKLHSITDNIASTLLGKRINGSEEYNSSLLVSVPRFENRNQYNIDSNNLPFDGWDVWHAYEFSVMTEKGLPVTRVLKLKYSCNSDYIVESKSLKLYLNSFNMTKIGSNIEECLRLTKDIIQNDLSLALKTEVYVNFLDSLSEKIDILNHYQNIISLVDEDNLVITEFKESPKLIKYEKFQDKQKRFLMFDSLRSNCRVTHQPDFGDVFIYYNSSIHINEDSLVKYLVSFRKEYHFHEECCEMIYKRIYDLLDEDDELLVCALYTRRGGIDICPARWSKNCNEKDVYGLLDLSKFARYGIKQ